ncbi:MAG: N-acetyltransferase [Methylobacteriaceae bacterium]|nr:N-acetyltransferase [Methylobacteriaceae bacterium]
MSDLAILIRPEDPGDADAIERLHERAFGPGRYARTAFRLRERAAPLPELCFTALVGTLLVGSVKMCPIEIGPGPEGGRHPALALGPLAVEPAFEGRGIGAALMARALDAATARGDTLVILVGDAPYYARFGFTPVPLGKLAMPGPVDPSRLLARELVPGALARVRGRVTGRR